MVIWFRDKTCARVSREFRRAAAAGCQVFACRDERSGDFIIDGVNVEVGGATKGAKASDLVLRDDIDLPRGKAVPLWLVCMGY